MRLLDSQIATLGTCGIPQWAVEALMADFVGRYLGAPTDLRTVEDWRKGMWTAVKGNWNDPNKRPKKPAEADATQQRAQSAAEVEARAKAQRDLKARQRGTGAPQ